jgi:N-acetylglucosamine-6-phosphate deacetylase
MPLRKKAVAAAEITALAPGAGPPANKIAARRILLETFSPEAPDPINFWQEMKMIRVTNGQIITPQQIYQGQDLLIEDGIIQAIAAAGSGEGEILDAGGAWVAPGMIDVHVHGSDGHDTMDATPEALHGMARFFARHGVSSYYPTTMSAPAADIQAAIDNVRHTPQPDDGAQHLGVHVEGPYLSADFPGAQPVDALHPPDPAEYAPWLESGVVKLMTIAPELEGMTQLIDSARQLEIELAIGHSGASYEQVLDPQ